MERLHRQYFNPYVNFIADIEGEMFHKKIIGDKCIFPELHLNCYSIFYKIGLVVAKYRNFPGFFNLTFLLRS